jgi:hypothetical protein
MVSQFVWWGPWQSQASSWGFVVVVVVVVSHYYVFWLLLKLSFPFVQLEGSAQVLG